MIASFLPDIIRDTERFELKVQDKGTHLQPLYHVSVVQLHQHATSLHAIVMPYVWTDSDFAYDYDDLIAHILWDDAFEAGRMSLYVIYPSEVKLEAKDLKLVEYGVQFVTASELEQRDLQSKSQLIDLEGMRGEFATKLLRRDEGHDQANRWGAYCLMYSLCLVTSEANESLVALTKMLSEDLYYKDLIAKLRKSTASVDLLARFSQARTNWFELVSRNGESLAAFIVEDELSQGWDIAYKEILGQIKIEFARSIKEFRLIDISKFDLVLLDLRLKGDMPRAISSVFEESVKQLPGVVIANEIRSKGILIPIVACTASDKAVTLDVLQQHEVNQYWTKPSPLFVFSADDVLKSAVDFLKKISNCVAWSQETRALVEGLEGIQRAVINPPQVHNEIVRKSKAFRALFFEKFSDARNVISNGLQFDLGYLIAHSLINELIFWKCRSVKISRTCWGFEFSKPTGEKVQIFHIEAASRLNGNKRRYIIEDDFRTTLRLKQSYGGDLSIQETQVFRCLLHDLGLTEAEDQFKNLVGVRNNLSLVHGKVGDKDYSTHKNATSEDISKLLGIYQQFVSKLI